MKGIRFALVAFCAAFGLAASADVRIVTEKPIIDGRLEETLWQDGWTENFHLTKKGQKKSLSDRPEYVLATDGSCLYFAFRLHCTDMAKVRARGIRGMWTSDTVELFLAPTGAPDDFYQFAVDYQGKRPFAQFWGESGNITPDPFAPRWQVAVGDTEDGWCVEAAIPFSSLYMTRNKDWKGTWLVNVGVSNHTMQEWSLSSPQAERFRESKRFERIGGFPMRRADEDFAATELSSVFDTVAANGTIGGTLTMKVFAAVAGTYAFTSRYATGEQTVALKAGDNVVKVRGAYPGKGRFVTDLVFRRTADGKVFARDYPVFVDFESIMVTFDKPGYRNNFYPGQDASEVCGKVRVAGNAPAKLTLEGPGFAKRTSEPGADGAFRFDTTGFAEGEAWLTVMTEKETKKVRIRKLAPTGRWMSWVENKRLVVNGKPGFKLGLTAPGYMGGEALHGKYRSEYTCMNPEYLRFRSCEPSRLVKGIEQREAVRDVKPSEEVFRKLDEVLAQYGNEDFTGYYLCDEPECRNISPVYLQYLYAYIAEKDPYHIVRIASRAAANYFRCCDLAESHDYLNLFKDENGVRDWRVTPSMIADRIAGHAAAQTPDKVLGCYSTAFAYLWQSYRNEYPTFDEYLASTFAGVINGAKSLQAYAYHDFADRPSVYHAFLYVNSTISGLEDLLLAEGETLVRTKDVQCVRYVVKGESCVVLVNFTRDPQGVDVPGLTGRYVEFRGDRTFDFPSRPSTSSTTIALQPLEVLIATSRPRGLDLPTREAVAAKIDRLEAERLGRDNQLLWRPDDITFETPGMKRFVVSTYKFIDGTRDVLGGYWEGGTNHVLGLAFKNGLKPTFDSVRVFGSNVGGLEVDVRTGGEWKTLKPVRRRTGKYMCELTFDEAVRPHRMQLRFTHPKRGKNRTELYEIELPEMKGK